MVPAAIEPKHKAGYLDLGLELGRAVRANREAACMSSMLSWLARTGEGGVKRNPWIGAGIRRNKETPRERYVELNGGCLQPSDLSAELGAGG